MNRLSVWGGGEKFAWRGKGKGDFFFRDFFTLSPNREPVHSLALGYL